RAVLVEPVAVELLRRELGAPPDHEDELDHARRSALNSVAGLAATLGPTSSAKTVVASHGRRCGRIRLIIPLASSSKTMASSMRSPATVASVTARRTEPCPMGSSQRTWPIVS